MTINLDAITVLNDIRERLLQVTPEQIEASARRLQPLGKSDEGLGVISSPSTRALWVLYSRLGSESAGERVKAQLAEAPEIERELNERATILDQLSDLAKELFWAQAKTDIGAHEYGICVGLRKEWQLVKMERRNPLAGLLPSLSGEGQP